MVVAVGMSATKGMMVAVFHTIAQAPQSIRLVVVEVVV